MTRKLLIPLLLCFFSATGFGQTTKTIDSLSFCFTGYKVPEGCTAESAYQVSCDNYSMTWLYMTDQMFQTMPEQLVDQLTAQVKIIKKEPVKCYLLNNEAKGYLVSFKSATAIRFQLIVYGIANHQPVLVQVVLDKAINKNDDIPGFAGDIIRLTK
jgi:translation elongation factor P/translation initiation factor 5A